MYRTFSIFAVAIAAAPSAAVASAATPPPTTVPASQPVAERSSAFAQFDDELTLKPRVQARDLTALTLEDLMSLEVTSVSRQRQRIADAPAAIYVITADDITHSGHTSIPELLRLSPGLNVARFSASSWAISSRGFNGVYANKLLVLMDGRTLYTPIFSGTQWADQDYILADLDRIEVIRGPGATLWGANAVNGVINITTKDARDTQGWLITALGGNIERQGAVRYGGQIDDDTYYRVYAKYRDTDNFDLFSGDAYAGDGWDSWRGGFRMDRHVSDTDKFTLQGDAYRSRLGSSSNLPTSTPPFTQSVQDIFRNDGENVLARWTHVVSDESDLSLQVYYDRLAAEHFVGSLTQHTFDVELQHRFRLGRRQEITWGTGARYINSSLDETDFFRFSDGERQDYLLSAFVQDAVAVVPERLTWFVGSKFEVGSIAGFEVQPSTRLLWTPNDRNSVWGAVSRAVRTPSQAEDDSRTSLQRGVLPPGVPFTVDVLGSDVADSEELTAYELGYRVKVSPALSFDIATFFNDYRNLRTHEPGAPVPDPDVPGRMLIPLINANHAHGESYGIELASTWKVNDDWRLTGSYTFLMLQLHRSRSSNDLQFENNERVDPRNQLQLHSQYKLTRHLSCDAGVYYTDNLAAYDIDSHVRVDLGLTWRPNRNFALSAWMQNLLDSGHQEFTSEFMTTASEIPRTFYIEARWEF